MNVILQNFQRNAADKILEKFLSEQKYAVLLIGFTGSGKTYIGSAVVQEMIRQVYHKDHPCLIPYVWITKANAVEQTRRVCFLPENFELDERLLWVSNYDQFRSKFGELFIECRTVIKLGLPMFKYVWHPLTSPLVYLCDESQSLKNDSQQSDVMLGISELLNYRALHISATPFDRVSAARVFVCHSRVKVKFGLFKQEMTPDIWPQWANEIAGGTAPTDYNKEACKRLRQFLNDEGLIVQVPNIKTKYHSYHTCVLFHLTPEEIAEHDAALEEYLRKVEEIEQRDPPNGYFLMLVALMMYRHKAEWLQAPYLAEAYDRIVKSDKAPVIACCFQDTICRIIDVLTTKYGYSRESISVIWGGKHRNKQKRLKLKGKQDEEFDFYGTEENISRFKIGTQSREDRQKNIDAFQDGKSLGCLFTFKSGGVALSLHHFKEGQKPREVIATPTYSVIELVQGFGRSHRINSVSDTFQAIGICAGTIQETHVMPKLIPKIASLGAILGSRESWADCLLDSKQLKDSLKAKGLLKNYEDTSDEDEEDSESTEGVYIEQSGTEMGEEDVAEDRPKRNLLIPELCQHSLFATAATLSNHRVIGRDKALELCDKYRLLPPINGQCVRLVNGEGKVGILSRNGNETTTEEQYMLSY